MKGKFFHTSSRNIEKTNATLSVKKFTHLLDALRAPVLLVGKLKNMLFKSKAGEEARLIGGNQVRRDYLVGVLLILLGGLFVSCSHGSVVSCSDGPSEEIIKSTITRCRFPH